jgi:transglutaminase-like putative cysteine protease
MAMPILCVRHETTYHYKRPVAFGEHRMMLRPRDDYDQKIIEAELKITPSPRRLAWTQDSFGNHVAIAQFAGRARELHFISNIRVRHAPAGFRATDIADFARTHPFAYAPEDWPDLERFTEPFSPHSAIDGWSAAFFRDDGTADTYELLGEMTRTIRRTFKHVSRHEKGIQAPAATLTLGRGSCRDLAVLMIAALRGRGIAARFASGYLHLADDDDDDLSGGNTHAWVQVYVPGPGWVDYDPSAGTVGNENLIRVAVAHDPREAIPLQGTWFGTAADHLAMKVAVKVTTAAAAGAADCMDVGMMNKRAEDGTEEAFLRRATVRSIG